MAEDPLGETLTAAPDVRARGEPAARRYGPFRIENVLGSGGMGVVYRAVDEVLGREVALKIVAGSSGEARDRLLREAKALAALQHRNVCTVYQAGEQGGEVYIAMERLPGPTLAELIERGPVRLAEVRRLARGIAAGLGHAHAAGLVHRDLKPSNVMLGADGEPKLVDFGLARAADAAVEPASPVVVDGVGAASTVSRVAGTPRYMAPEQLAGGRVGPEADVWAFGLILYELVTGRHPFAGRAMPELVDAIRGEPVALAEVPREIREVVRSCLERDPTRRPGADRLFARLGARARRWPVVAGIVVVATMAIAIWVWPRSAEPRHEPPSIAWALQRTIPNDAAGLVPISAEHVLFNRGGEAIVRTVDGREWTQDPLPDGWVASDVSSWSGRLVLARETTGPDAERVVWRYDVNGRRWERVFPGVKVGTDVAHALESPDGRHLALFRTTDAKIVDEHGRVIRYISFAAGEWVARGATWSADSRSLVIARERPAGQLVEQLSLDGQTHLLLDAARLRHPTTDLLSLAATGEFALVLQHTDRTATLLALPLGGGAPIEIASWSGRLRPARLWVLDGQLWFWMVTTEETLATVVPGQPVRERGPSAERARVVGGRHGVPMIVDDRAWALRNGLGPIEDEAMPVAVAGSAALLRRGDRLERIDARARRELRTLAASERVRCAADGSWCVLIDFGVSVTLRELDPWSGKLGTSLHTFTRSRGREDPERGFALAPRRSELVCAENSALSVVELETGKTRRIASGIEVAQHVEYSSDGRAVVVTGVNAQPPFYVARRIDLTTLESTVIATSDATWYGFPFVTSDDTVTLTAQRFTLALVRVPLE